MSSGNSAMNPYRLFANICVHTKINADNTSLVNKQAMQAANMKGLIGVNWLHDHYTSWDELWRAHPNISDWPADQQELYNQQIEEFQAKPLEELLETPAGKSAIAEHVRISRGIGRADSDTFKNFLRAYRSNYSGVSEQLQQGLKRIDSFRQTYPTVATELARDLSYLELRTQRMLRDMQQFSV